MKKVIRVTMPDGSEWDVPVELIAQNRAVYVAHPCIENGEGSSYDEIYDKEFQRIINNNSELIDWGVNNMEWDEDIKDYATPHTSPTNTDYQVGWVNGNKQIIEITELPQETKTS